MIRSTSRGKYRKLHEKASSGGVPEQYFQQTLKE
jgi:hypothetical protein